MTSDVAKLLAALDKLGELLQIEGKKLTLQGELLRSLTDKLSKTLSDKSEEPDQ